MKSFLLLVIVLIFAGRILGQDLTPDTYYLDEGGNIVEAIRCGTVDIAPPGVVWGPENLQIWEQQNPEATSLLTIEYSGVETRSCKYGEKFWISIVKG